MQLEGKFTRKLLGAGLRVWLRLLHIGKSGFKQGYAVLQCFNKALFFHLQGFGDLRLLLAQTRVGIAHQGHQVGYEFVEEGLFLPEFVAVADGAADDAALHIAAAFGTRQHAIAGQKRGGADVVGNDFERGVVQVGAACFAGGSFDERGKQVNLVVAVHMLQNGSQTLKPHACIYAGCGQLGQAAVGVHFKLHEHVVPDFDVAVAIFIRAAWGAACNVRAVVVENFAARAARACIGHHPEVVALVGAAFVVANANDALGWQADDVEPDVVGFVVVFIYGGCQALGRQAVDLGEQLPAPFNAFFFEVVAKAPVAHHLEKSMVARGVAYVFKVVVLAACTQARLHAGCAHIGALVCAQKHVFELHHAAVGKHQRGVVIGNQRAAGHYGVTFAGKKVQKALANFSNGCGRFGHEKKPVEKDVKAKKLKKCHKNKRCHQAAAGMHIRAL